MPAAPSNDLGGRDGIWRDPHSTFAARSIAVTRRDRSPPIYSPASGSSGEGCAPAAGCCSPVTRCCIARACCSFAAMAVSIRQHRFSSSRRGLSNPVTTASLGSDADVGRLIDHRSVVTARQLAPGGDDLSHGVIAIGRLPCAHRCPLNLQIPKRHEPLHNRSLIHPSFSSELYESPTSSMQRSAHPPAMRR